MTQPAAALALPLSTTMAGALPAGGSGPIATTDAAAAAAGATAVPAASTISPG